MPFKSGTCTSPPRGMDSKYVPTRLKHPVTHVVAVSLPPTSILTILPAAASERDPTAKYTNPEFESVASGCTAVDQTSFSPRPPSPPFKTITAVGLSPSRKSRLNINMHAERCSQPSQFSSRPDVPTYPKAPRVASAVKEVNRPWLSSTTPSHANGIFKASAEPSKYISDPDPASLTKSASLSIVLLKRVGYQISLTVSFTSAAPAKTTW